MSEEHWAQSSPSYIQAINEELLNHQKKQSMGQKALLFYWTLRDEEEMKCREDAQIKVEETRKSPVSQKHAVTGNYHKPGLPAGAALPVPAGYLCAPQKQTDADEH